LTVLEPSPLNHQTRREIHPSSIPRASPAMFSELNVGRFSLAALLVAALIAEAMDLAALVSSAFELLFCHHHC
jgi:hypothetical protein